jgi:putative membrane protein
MTQTIDENQADSRSAPPKQQQQVIFEDDELQSPPQADPMQPQVLFDNDQYQAVALDKHDSEQSLAGKRNSPGLWQLIIALLSLVLVIEAVGFFITGFSESPITTSLYGVVFFSLLFISGSALLRELSGLRQFKRHQKAKTDIQAVFDGETIKGAQTLCQEITSRLPSDLVSEQEQQWNNLLNEGYSDAELIQQYSNQVLCKVDEKAMSEVAKYSSETVVLVALSPLAIVDMLIVLSRNLKLIDKISGLYGLKMGYWSRIKLIRQVFTNILFAGASELIADIGTEVLSADLLGKLSARLAQGLGAGMLTARLGINTIKLCRPIPFTDKQPKLSQVRKEILKQIKGLIKK